MRRTLKWFGWIVAILILVPVTLAGFVLVAANTDTGRRAIERVTPELTGDTVRLAGLAGRFPDALRVARIELRDPQGSYATVSDARLDWSPMQLLHWRIVIDRLTAAGIELARMPASSSSGSSGLPAPVTLRQLQVTRLDVGAAIAGTAVSVGLDGSAEASSPSDFQADIDVTQIGGPGRYTLSARSEQADLKATLKVAEPARGLIAGLAGLPDLGPIAVDATLQGPRAAIATRVALTAGPLHATVGGSLDLDHQAMDLLVSAAAPAMQPRPDISWQSVALDAHVRGPFARPDAAGRLQVDRIAAAGTAVASLTADIAGNAGRLRLDGKVTGLRVPAANPDLLANDPLTIQADARLDQPDRPLHFTVRHTLFSVEAEADTGEQKRVDATVKAADIAPFAAMGGVALAGGASLALHAARQGDTTTVTADGSIGVTGGMRQAHDLVGDNGRLHIAASLHGADITVSQLQFTGQSASLTAKGSVASGNVDVTWTMGVSDLAAAEPSLAGQLQAAGKVSGTTDNLTLTSDITGGVATRGMSSGTLTAHIEANGLPNSPAGQIALHGSLLDAPVNLAVAMRRTTDGLMIDIRQAGWKSLQAGGSLQLPTATMVPAGDVHLAIGRLADFAPLAGRAIAGSLDARLNASPEKAHLTLRLDDAGSPGLAAASRIMLDATVDQPQTHPVLDARLDADGLSAQGVAGSARLTATGPAEAVATRLTASLANLSGAPAQVTAAASLDATGRTATVQSFQADWHGQPLRLLAPVRIAFDNGLAIDRLRLGVRQAVLEASGRIGAALDVTASLRNLPADIAAAVAPGLAINGTVSGDARITGTTARPAGQVRLAANGLRARTGPGSAMPPANITATLTLAGTDAKVDARATAGRSHLGLTGVAPLTASGSLGLRAEGMLDLAVVDPILSAGGRRVRGQLNVDLAISGAAAAPRFAGSAQLSGGDVQDYASGVHLSDIAAQIQGDGGELRIARFTAKAGAGTIALSGQIGATSPGLPVDLTLTAHDAKPLASDLISAIIDADLRVRGEALGQLSVGGSVHVQRADIRVPERLPAAIAVLPVRQAGSPPPKPAPPAPAASIALNVTVDAPQQVFVRGRGVDVEFGGSMTITGSTTALRTVGGLNMRRGTLSVAGRTLDFSEGQISFNGSSMTDPALNLVATSSNGNVTATLTIGGTAQNPKITLSSVPVLPQDEVLAHLLFGSGVGRLGALEVAQIAAGLATLTGAGGVGDPLDKVRQGLGLDRLSMGSSTAGSPTLEAGRYIAPGVYLGAQQSASGGGTQASVQVDIAKGLKLQGSAGTGGGSATGAAGASNGTSVGLTYQFQY